MSFVPDSDSDLRALLRACRRTDLLQPDYAPNLMLADWLEEQGDRRGELIRLSLEIANSPVVHDEMKELLANFMAGHRELSPTPRRDALSEAMRLVREQLGDPILDATIDGLAIELSHDGYEVTCSGRIDWRAAHALLRSAGEAGWLATITIHAPNDWSGLSAVARYADQLLLDENESFTDEVCGLLRELPELRRLSLRNNRNFGAGLSEFVGLQRLQSLSLDRCTGVSDAALAPLAELQELQILDLNSCFDLSDAAMRTIIRLPNLRSLCIENCGNITAQGVALLSAVPTLEELRCGFGVAVTDDVPAALRALPKLRKLDVAQSVLLTDQGLKYLAEQKTLRELNLSWCSGLSFIGIAHLQDALPECNIKFR